MKNTNKNMLYTFWSGAILLCLALVAVVLVFTNAVGNTHTSKPKDDPRAGCARKAGKKPLRSRQDCLRFHGGVYLGCTSHSGISSSDMTASTCAKVASSSGVNRARMRPSTVSI